MEFADNIKRIFKNASVSTNPKADDEILNQLIRAYRESRQIHTEPKNNIWRIIIKSRITKPAAVAALIVAVIAGIIFINKTVPTTYALEQTIRAQHSVRYLHIKVYTIKEGNEPRQFWIECDKNGNVRNARLYFPESPDGPKTTIWYEGKAEVYFKRKNIHFIANAPELAQEILGMVHKYDPKNAVEQMRDLEAKGKVKITAETPSDNTQPILLTATFKDKPKKLKFFVDQATKLVTAIETYLLKDGQYKYQGVTEFHDYNVPIKPEMFTLEGELPDNVVKIDQTTQKVGLEQGDLSDEEIAIKVAKQFFEALITEDYEKAGRLLEGTPADFMKKTFGKVKFLQIISVGPVKPHPNPATKGVVVPVTVEIQNENGEAGKETFEYLGIRKVYNQPGRWTIFGGI